MNWMNMYHDARAMLDARDEEIKALTSKVSMLTEQVDAARDQHGYLVSAQAFDEVCAERDSWKRAADAEKMHRMVATAAFDQRTEELSIAKRQAVPEGFIPVPPEPTPEMVVAFMKEFYKKEKSFDTAACYRAMLAASQSATGGA